MSRHCTVTVYLRSSNEREKLDEHARRAGLSRSALVRAAIDHYVPGLAAANGAALQLAEEAALAAYLAESDD